MNSTLFHRHILELVRRTSAFLPPDVSEVIEAHRVMEQKGSKADLALELVSQNIGLAKRLSAPICQDTGTITFYIATPRGFDQLELEDVCKDAVAEATAKGYLRQNSVDSVTGHNTGNNLGPGSPVFHWHQHRADDGGRAPGPQGRRLREHRAPSTRCRRRSTASAATATWTACAAASSTRSGRRRARAAGPASWASASAATGPPATNTPRRSFCARSTTSTRTPKLAALEARILDEANRLDIGPMGFGGKLTVGGARSAR